MAKKSKTTNSLPSALTAGRLTPSNPAARPLAPAGTSAAQPRAGKRSAGSPRTKSTSPLTPTPLKATAAASATTSPAALPAPGQGAPPVAPREAKVTFTLVEPQAKRVCVSGTFNAWAPDATPLARETDGQWAVTLALPPGRHEYKFVVDGQWLPDPKAAENVFNAHGTLNSVVEVKA